MKKFILQHAIVYGDFGLIGWAVVDQLLQCYPQDGTFSKVTAVTRHARDLADTIRPESELERPELQLVSRSTIVAVISLC